MRHLDLFSGQGGMAIAIHWLGHETVGFCDNDPNAQELLALRWPGVPVYDDIRTLNGTSLGTIDIVTGGPPCQPFSSAGRMGGATDPRNLWPEMFRVIDEARPTYVLVENSPNIRKMALAGIKSDLESIGYDVRSGDIPALAVGAAHRRMRHWITAHYAGQRQPRPGQYEQPLHPAPGRTRQATQPVDGHQRPSWPDQSGVGRVVHGVPRGVDRLRLLGNSIVPAVAYEILRVMIGEAA